MASGRIVRITSQHLLGVKLMDTILLKRVGMRRLKNESEARRHPRRRMLQRRWRWETAARPVAGVKHVRLTEKNITHIVTETGQMHEFSHTL
jgi:hypothetical protein